MSLRRLMVNYMTIQSSEGAVQAEDGSIDRASSWQNIFENEPCNVQEKSKQTVTERFSKQQEEHNDLIYHLNKTIYETVPSVQLRILVAKNPHEKITDFSSNNSDNIEIYEFKGRIEQIKSKRRSTPFFILRCERNDKWNL